MLMTVRSGNRMMRCGHVVLVLVGSIAITAPAIASDKLPKPRERNATPPSKTAPAELPDPSTEPIPDDFAPPTASAPDAGPPAAQPPASEPAPAARGAGGWQGPPEPHEHLLEWGSAGL
jgi:hypothetical protein